MLRRSCLRLVAALAALSLVAACGLTEAPVNSDNETASYPSILEGRELLRSGDVEASKQHFEQLLGAHPTSLMASRGLQDARRALMGPEEYLAYYDAGVETAPQSSLAWYLHGRSRIERSSAAEKSFLRAIELDSGNAWAVAGLAYLAYESGDLFRTVQIYEDAIARAPRSAQLRLLLGNQYLELKLYVDAQRQLDVAHRLAPEDLEIWAALGKVWLALNEEQRAYEILSRTRATEPRIAHIYPSLSAIYLRRGTPEAAERSYREGLGYGLKADDELAAEIQAGLVLQRLRGQEAEEREQLP